MPTIVTVRDIRTPYEQKLDELYQVAEECAYRLNALKRERQEAIFEVAPNTEIVSIEREIRQTRADLDHALLAIDNLEVA